MTEQRRSSLQVGQLQLTDLTPDQLWIMEEASSMVGRVLDQIEATFAPGQQTISTIQMDKLKKLVQIPMYNFRNDVLRRFAVSKVTSQDKGAK